MHSIAEIVEQIVVEPEAQKRFFGPEKRKRGPYMPTSQLRYERRYAAKMGVRLDTVRLMGGAEKLEKLEPHIQRLLLGISKRVSA
jgi:hypothetical protein